MATQKQPRWKTSKYLNPFSEDLGKLGDLTCSIHERCDLRCDPSRKHVVRAVDLCLTPSDSEDESDENEDEKGDTSDAESPLPTVQPVISPIRLEPGLGELTYTMAPGCPHDLYVPERPEPTKINESLPPFVYDALPVAPGQRHIRLLKIKPAIYLADVLDCDLITVSLDDYSPDSSPAFDALSYCWSMEDRPEPQCRWAPSTGPRKILVNGKQFVVQESLALALHRYRRLGCTYIHRDRERWKGKAEYIWADGLCINQSDTAEKTTQVGMMGDIYRRARRVFIELGAVPDHWISAFHLMHSIQSVRQFVRARGALIDDDLIHGDFELPPPDHISWMALAYPLSMPWYTRTWVVQEMVLPQRPPLVMFGKYSFNLSTFNEAVQFAMNQGYQRALGALGTPAFRAIGYLNLIKMDFLRKNFHLGRSMSVEVLESLRDFKTTDPRDKIFGVLPLLSEDVRIPPDYSSTAEDVYLRFAEKVVLAGKAARLLDSAGLHRRLAHTPLYPTWVPDWRAQKSIPRIISSIRQYPYCASGNLQAAFTLLKGKDVSALSVQAYFPSRIAYTSHVPDGSDDGIRAELNEIWQFVNRHRDLCHAQYANSEGDLLNALARTLLMDDLYKHGHNTLALFCEISEPGKMLRDVLADPNLFKSRDNRGKRAVVTAIDTFAIQVCATLPGRKFAVTEDAKFALVPAPAEPGDLVAIIPGVTVPLILRPSRDAGQSSSSAAQYELVGDSFVHQIMYGEALKDPDFRLDNILIV